MLFKALLILTSGRISGTIPTVLGLLSRLGKSVIVPCYCISVIYVPSNVPSEILSFRQNELTGAIPAEFGQLSDPGKLVCVNTIISTLALQLTMMRWR